ncbi:putative reverse transcriptase zinc-binding domain-containing protein [Helianthus annuus]|nr:putative reverse transcriptase zinc-binding domain-containing protein [Helianthus annuus]
MDWNWWVPKKRNILIWKAEMDKILSRVVLKRRGVDVGSTVCSMCRDQHETSEHLFTSCLFASLVWGEISRWCGVQSVFAFSIRDLLLLHKSPVLGRIKKVFQSVILTTCWVI